MKIILKIVFTIIFIIGAIFAINKLIANYSNDSLIFISVSIMLFLMHLFAWIAPKMLLNLCWKISNLLPDSFDYDASYKKLSVVDLGILIAANIFLAIGILVI